MQEEVDQKTIALAVKTGKLTAQVLQAAIRKYLAARQKGTGKAHHGQQSLRQLKKDGSALSNIEITDANIGLFKPCAKKYDIDFTLRKDRTTHPPRYIVIFKSKQADNLEQAFKEFTAKKLQQQERPSIRKTLAVLKEKAAARSSQQANEKIKERGLINLLCDRADDKYGGRLPVHVRLILDEFANIGQIPNFDKLIATIRSREISASIILQSQSQLKAIYKDAAEIISDNCDCTLFLSGRGKNAKEIADVLGKETIDSYNQSENRGAQTSHGLNYQKLGKDLPLSEELEKWLTAQKKHTHSKYVLAMQNHKPLTKSSYRCSWRLIERELPDTHLTAHILRHTYITRLFEAGLDIKEIQYLAGHSTMDMTLKVYTHYDRKSRETKTAEKVREALSASA